MTLQRIETISSHWSHTTWVGATIPLDHLATPLWVTLRRLQVLDLLRKLRNASPWQTVLIIQELQPFRISFEIADALKTKITRTIYQVTNAHVDSSHRTRGTFGLSKGRPLRQLSIDDDTVPGLVRLLSSDEPPVLRFASWALGKLAKYTIFGASAITDSCRPLVALVQHGVVDVHIEALVALANLSRHSEIGRRAIVDADALPEFVRLLSSSDFRVLDSSLMVLCNIASQDSLNTFIIDAGCAKPLFRLLRHKVLGVHRQALRMIANLTWDSEVGRQAIVDADGLPELVLLLSSSDSRVLYYALMTLYNIASQDSLTTSIIYAGSAKPLVQLLRHEVIDVRCQALAALANLTWDSEVGRQAIVDAGALPELVHLLSSSNCQVLECSLLVLYNISLQNSLTTYIIDAGSARPLVQLLRHEVIGVHRQAVAALVNLNGHSKVARQAIVDAGALPEFVRLLSSSESRVLEYSLIALHTIFLRNSLTTSIISGSVKPFVQLLRHDVIDVHREALATLVNVSYHSEFGRRAIVDARALPELVRLLWSSDPLVLKSSAMALRNIAVEDSFKNAVVDAGSARPLVQLLQHEVIDVHRQALAAFANLSYHSEVGRRTVADAGALPELVRLLSSSDPRVLEYSSMVLSNIACQDSLVNLVIDADSAKPLVQLLRHEIINVHCQALSAVANLTCKSEFGNQAIVDAGALPELVRLLSSSDPQVLNHSSMALRNISLEDFLKTSVIDAGSARPLVQLLQHEVIDVRRQALAALANLSHNSKIGQQAIVDTGSFSEFRSQLVSFGYQVDEYTDCDS